MKDITAVSVVSITWLSINIRGYICLVRDALNLMPSISVSCFTSKQQQGAKVKSPSLFVIVDNFSSSIYKHVIKS